MYEPKKCGNILPHESHTWTEGGTKYYCSGVH